MPETEFPDAHQWPPGSLGRVPRGGRWGLKAGYGLDCSQSLQGELAKFHLSVGAVNKHSLTFSSHSPRNLGPILLQSLIASHGQARGKLLA